MLHQGFETFEDAWECVYEMLENFPDDQFEIECQEYYVNGK